MKTFTYKKDVYYGTFITAAVFMLLGFAGWYHFTRLPHGESPLSDFYQFRMPPEPKCDICRWTSPDA